MSSMNELYRQVIVEHFKNPRNKGLKNTDEYTKLRLKNPSCGDDVTIEVKIKDHHIEEEPIDRHAMLAMILHVADRMPCCRQPHQSDR